MAQLQSTVVSGNTSTTGFMSAGGRKLSMGILDLNSQGSPTQFKIKTTIPWNAGAADFTVNIKGFRYSGPQMVSLSIGWHHYLDTFYNETAISNGGWAPVITLARSSDNFVIIHIAGPGYWPKLYVESLYSSAYTDSYATGWTWSDADLSDCTDVSVVSYTALAGNITGTAGSETLATVTGRGASTPTAITVTATDSGIVNQSNGNASQWYGRILSKNSTNDRAAFLGTYASIAGVFSHNNALNAWADLYVNTVDGSTGGTVRMPSTVLVNGNQVLHAGNYNSYSPTLTGTGASGTWGISISGNAATATTATNAGTLDNIDSTGFGRAFSSGYSFHGTNVAITTADFISILSSQGAFAQPYWVARGSWCYACNGFINDTGLGNIHLAGCTIEVIGDATNFTIRIHTPTTSSNGVINREFIYVQNSTGYNPGWRIILSNANYNDYAPSLTGTGASGTWGINVTGTAAGETLATVTGRGASTSTAVTFNGAVDIGGSVALSFGSSTRQMINLWSTSYGIGVQSGTTYFRTGGRFSWFRNGTHSTAENDAGSGGTVAMTLDSSSNLVVTGDVTAFSDIRTKENIFTIDNSLEKVKSLRGVYFTRKDSEDKSRKLGVIAQEVRKVLPEVVVEDDNGMLTVAYGNLVGVLIEAIKEQQSQIEQLKDQVNQLKENN